MQKFKILLIYPFLLFHHHAKQKYSAQNNFGV